MTRIWLLSVALVGCSPAAVNYGALQQAAIARQRWAQGGQASGEVRRLLAEPLSADAAARIALTNNRGARAAAEELGIAQAQLASVKRLPNPTLEGAMRFRELGNPELELSAMLDLSALLLAISRSDAAEADVVAAKLEAVGVLVNLSFEARRAFVDVQAALELCDLRQAALHAFEVSALAAEQMRAVGNVTLLTLATQQALREEARVALQQSGAELASARERLNAVMGVFGQDIQWKVSGRLGELPARELPSERLEREALLASIALSASKQRYAAAAKHAGVANVSGFLPELKAGVSAQRAEQWGVGPAVELELPLLYQGQGEAGVARARLKQAEHRYADLAVRVRSAARTARVELEVARAAAVHARDVILPLRQRVLQQSQLEYNGMLVGIFELLQAKREQLAASEQYLTLRHRYWLRRLDAEQLLAGGRPLSSPVLVASGSGGALPLVRDVPAHD